MMEDHNNEVSIRRAMPMEFSTLTASTFSLRFPSLTNSSQAFVPTTCWLKLLFSRSPGASTLLDEIASSQSSSDSTSEQHLAQLVTPTFLKCFSHLASGIQQSLSFPPTSLAVLSQFPLLDSSLLPRPLNVRPAQGSVFVLAFLIYIHTLDELLMWLPTSSFASWRVTDLCTSLQLSSGPARHHCSPLHNPLI